MIINLHHGHIICNKIILGYDGLLQQHIMTVPKYSRHCEHDINKGAI